MAHSHFFLLISIFITYSTLLSGNTFYIDPNHGSITNNGSISSPWSTLQEVVENNKIESYQWNEHPPTASSSLIVKNGGAPVKAGDTLLLLSGYHGSITIMEFFNNNYITIKAMEGHTPHISNINIVGGCYWKIIGLTISPEFAENYKKTTLIELESHDWRGQVSQITIQNCKGYSVADASAWSMEQWDTMSCNGIQATGNDFLIENNELHNINFGITVLGNQTVVRGNSIINFSGDGMRGLGNDLLFEYNTVKNCYEVNANHDDGFQSWSIDDDPPRERVILRGNTFINYEDPNQPFLGSLQGIGCFDGPYIDWIVENNVVITDHWHGISLYGAQNCRIVNNTVIDPNNIEPGPPWIGIFDHKDGNPSKNCIIRNNIATSFNVGNGCTTDHNLEIDYNEYDSYFVDAAHCNVDLVEGSAAIDTGTIELAPSIDIETRVRPHGNGVDVGAYEYGSYYVDSTIDVGFSGDGFICYPNPFNNGFTVQYNLSENSHVLIKLYDLLGRHITFLQKAFMPAGTYKFNVEANKYNLTKGLYICRFVTDNEEKSIVISHMQ